MAQLASAGTLKATRDNAHLPPLYWKYLRIWTVLGIPAFFALVIVFYLMVAKPL